MKPGTERVGLFLRTGASVELVRLDIGRIDLDAHRLADEIDRQDESSARVLPHQTSNHALQRSVNYLDDHAFLDEGAWIVLKIGLDELANAVDLDIWDRRWFAVE